MSSAPRVLVCDDETQILRALRVILPDAGFEALPANTAEEALDVAAVQHPAAAIIDLVLPDGDGVEVCRRLREWSQMPIIVLSPVGDEDAKRPPDDPPRAAERRLGYAEDTAVLRAHIANLRRKIEPEDGPRFIRTDPGVGYRFAG